MAYGLIKPDQLPEGTELNFSDLFMASQKGILKGFKISVLYELLNNSFSGSIEEAKDLQKQLISLKNDIGSDANALTNVIKQAEENLEALLALGDSTALAEKVETNRVNIEQNTNNIENNKKSIEANAEAINKNTASLKDLTNDKFDKSNVVNNLATTEEGFALDAMQGKVLNDKIDINSKRLMSNGGTLSDFTQLISDMLNGNFSVANVQGSAMSNSPTASSNETCWFTVITFGVVNRCTQIAIQCFVNSFRGKMYIRYQHDAKVSAWQALN